jgi:hypothetical protein
MVLFKFVIVFSRALPPFPFEPSLTHSHPRFGDSQWTESLLLPPFPHHNDEDDLASGNNKKHSTKRMRKALAKLFA